MTIGAILLCLLGAEGQEPARDLQELARRVEARRGVPRRDDPPAYARNRGEPLATFGIVADVHYHAGRDRAYLDRAVRFLNERRPAVVLFLGDTVWAGSPDGFRPIAEEVRGILRDTLEAPSRVVKGDNDSRDHEPVWGSAQFSFDLAGIHFAAVGMTRDWEGNGMGYYDELDWLAEDLAGAAGRPAVVLTHVPANPPFMAVGSADLVAAMRRAGNVAANFAGHLHTDLEWTDANPPTFAAPSLGETEGAPVKIASIYEDGIVMETYRADGDAYVFDRKWQFIEFPEGLRAAAGGLANPADGPATPTTFLTDRGPMEEFMRRFLGPPR